MIKVSNTLFKRIVSVLLCSVFILLSVGCTNKSSDKNNTDISDNTTGTENTDTVEEASINDLVEDITEVTHSYFNSEKGKYDDNGKPIKDFDEYVNGDWLAKQKDSGKDSVSAYSELDDIVSGRLHEILENTDTSSLSENDGLYKTIKLFEEFKSNDPAARITSIKNYLKPIEEADSLDDLLALYCDDRYHAFDMVFEFKILPDSNGNNTLFYNPESFSGLAGSINLEMMDSKDDKDKIMSYFNDLGYSSDMMKDIVTNAGIIDKKIYDFSIETANASSLYYVDEDLFAEKKINAPIFDILEKTNSIGEKHVFLAIENCEDFFNDIYKEENVQALRDYMLLCAIMKLSLVSGNESLLTAAGTSNDEVAFSMVRTYACDVLNEEYKRLYMDEAALNSIITLETDIKRNTGSLVNKTEWLDNAGKTKAREKVQGMREFFGTIADNGDDLSDLVVSGDVIDDLLSLLISRKNYYVTQLDKIDTDRDVFRVNMLDSNAWFTTNYNSLTVSTGLICNPLCAEDVPYEQKLGYIGIVIAHEVSHSYDPFSISYDRDGYYGPWLSESQRNEYYARVQNIVDYFDKMKLEYGTKLDGNLIKYETFADIMAVQICLRILEKMDDPDYDLFFRTYAECRASYDTKAGQEYTISRGYLPGKQRINCILGQFDKFYEIYDIDKKSSFYVPEDKRIKLF